MTKTKDFYEPIGFRLFEANDEEIPVINSGQFVKLFLRSLDPAQIELCIPFPCEGSMNGNEFAFDAMN